MFTKPNRREYGAKPFWAWNGNLNKDELIRQTHIIDEMGFGGYFMHSRTGLVTEYLGDEWFDDINACADEAEKENLESWLYDEDRWPSGSAGGIATKEVKYRMQYIRCEILLKESFEWNEDIVCAFAADVDGINYTNCVKILKHTDIASLPQKQIITFTQEYMVPTPVYNGCSYLDTMSAEATEHFIETTHELYAKKCGDRLGKSIQGIFTDEPHRGALMSGFTVPNRDPKNLAPYTDTLFEEFEKAFGYDLKDHLPELFLRKDGKVYAKVKWQYTELLTRLFIKNFAKPYHRWCKEHNMLVTGHVLHEDNLTCQVSTNGSVMRYYEHMDVPGVDILCNHNKNYCVVKQLASVGRQTGKKRLLSELDGCTGWQMRFTDYKAIGDWQAIMGINLRCPHLSWYTMQGEAKRDYPASILHQSSWYKAYSYLEDHYTRIGEITAESERICDTAVIMPVETLWAQIYAGWADAMSNTSAEIAPYEIDFEKTYRTLLKAHVDFDYADEEMLSRLGDVKNDRFVIGEAKYKRVIVPSMLTIRKSTLDLLKKFKEKGGEVIFSGITPILVDAEENDEALKFAEECEKISIDELINLRDKITVSSDQIMLQTYRNENGKFCFLLNTEETPVKDVEINFGKDIYLQLWDTLTGKKYTLEAPDGIYKTNFAAGQLILLTATIEDSLETLSLPSYKKLEEVEADDNTELVTDEPNVLVLDYARFQIDDGEISDLKEILIADRCIRSELGLPVRGGEMLQPWFTAMSKPPVKAKVSVFFSFEVKDVESPVYLCCEERENFEISVNGINLSEQEENGFYIDCCFKRFNISNYISEGVNTITLMTDYNQNSNLEAIYILGDFAASTEGYIEPKNEIKFGDITKMGYPFYGGKLTYKVHFPKVPKDNQKAILRLSDMENNACYKVGNKYIAFPPYTCDVTDELSSNGDLDIEIYLTRRNMFGPLHGIPKYIDALGPDHFYGGDNTEYVLFESGLTKKPVIEITEEEI